MTFYIWDYLGYRRALETGYAEFKSVKKAEQVNYGGEFPKFPKWGQITRIGGFLWQPPYIIKMTTKKLGDPCTDGIALLVSRKFHDAWGQCGWSEL